MAAEADGLFPPKGRKSSSRPFWQACERHADARKLVRQESLQADTVREAHLTSDEAHRAVIEGTGKGLRGLGNAGAKVTVQLAPDGSGTGTRQTGVGFQSERWVREGNPAGIGIVTNMPDGTPGRVYTPYQWGVIHATHLAGYAGIEPPAAWKALDFRWGAMLDRGWFGIATTVHDLDERWAEDAGNYGDKIESRWNNYGFPTMKPYTTEPEKEPGMVSTVIPGLEGGRPQEHRGQERRDARRRDLPARVRRRG